MHTAKIFLNGRSQAVRLPKEFRFRESEVFVEKRGELVVLSPKKAGWSALTASLSQFSPDYPPLRRQPRQQKLRSPFR